MPVHNKKRGVHSQIPPVSATEQEQNNDTEKFMQGMTDITAKQGVDHSTEIFQQNST